MRKCLTVERKDEILALRESGATLGRIASQFHCTHEAVRQVCRVHGERRRLEEAAERFLRLGISPSEIRIDQVPMSTRAFRALNALDVIFLIEVSKFTQREILSLKGISKTTLVEIEDRILKPFSLTLAESNG